METFLLALSATVSNNDLWMVTDDLVEISTVPSRAFIVPVARGACRHNGDAAGIRSVIVKRWREIKRKEREARRKRLAELERKARDDVERVMRMDEGNGRGV